MNIYEDEQFDTQITDKSHVDGLVNGLDVNPVC